MDVPMKNTIKFLNHALLSGVYKHFSMWLAFKSGLTFLLHSKFIKYYVSSRKMNGIKLVKGYLMQYNKNISYLEEEFFSLYLISFC
jgi:hypothetical protein